MVAPIRQRKFGLAEQNRQAIEHGIIRRAVGADLLLQKGVADGATELRVVLSHVGTRGSTCCGRCSDLTIAIAGA